MSQIVLDELFGTNDPGTNQVPPNGPGLIRRLDQTYTGDPIGPGQYGLTCVAVTALTVPDVALSALLTVETANIRLTFDGQVPAAGVGLLVPAGVTVLITGRPSLKGAQFIEDGGAAVVNVTYCD